jgi:hypothetical protein
VKGFAERQVEGFAFKIDKSNVYGKVACNPLGINGDASAAVVDTFSIMDVKHS